MIPIYKPCLKDYKSSARGRDYNYFYNKYKAKKRQH